LLDPAHYAGWDGALGACEADATSMEAIAGETGYESHVLLTPAATRDSVRDAIRDAAARLQAGDIFLVSYAGHGGQVPDVSGDEPDFSDETWCLYDGQLIDDELRELWKGFAPGVRVLVFSDSCHSGTVTRAARGEIDEGGVAEELRSFGIEKPVFRFMPPHVARETYKANQSFYDGVGASVPTEKGDPAATVRLISGCQDDQTSADGVFNGLFTGTMLKVWDGGAFEGDYARFHADIVERMPKCQIPNHFIIGPGDPAFDGQRPFSIEG
jgi:hypothetical protein